jgi:hypothetical protein
VSASCWSSSPFLHSWFDLVTKMLRKELHFNHTWCCMMAEVNKATGISVIF